MNKQTNEQETNCKMKQTENLQRIYKNKQRETTT